MKKGWDEDGYRDEDGQKPCDDDQSERDVAPTLIDFRKYIYEKV